MDRRPIKMYSPSLERLEAKQLLSAGPSSTALASHRAAAPHAVERSTASPQKVSPDVGNIKPSYGYLAFRITNADQYNRKMRPPYGQVLVQTKQPVPGQVYNLLYVVVRNGTAQTFNANSGFYVRIPQSRTKFPILTGNETWAPGQRYVFYILTKKYYPMPSQQHSGFLFDLGGAYSVSIPGPSAIALRLKYDPATWAQTLDNIVTFGPGNQGGRGAKFGLPNTAINEFVSARTNRNDLAGYF
ncbi:MAG: hypothetical protein ACP5XB_26595 [Isosphaeraceae bacterium]